MVLQHITNTEEAFTVPMEKRISRMMKIFLRLMRKKEKSNHELRRTLQDS
jgi:hypothetical protein